MTEIKAVLERNIVEMTIGMAVIVGATVLAAIGVLTAEQVMYLYVAVLGYIFGRATTG